ncbi:MAG: hypothetical protein QOC99_1539 [Acidobacteriota bacterium]|jgi:hypothetical protein|nr:hypothetical protein [Acidobacteriota bacterium]
MTLEEKVACLGTNPCVPRLSVKSAGQMEGLHGLAVMVGRSSADLALAKNIRIRS